MNWHIKIEFLDQDDVVLATEETTEEASDWKNLLKLALTRAENKHIETNWKKTSSLVEKV